MATVGLNMIVKNEAHVIRRCLDSVWHLLDYYVIVDTGSTDGTQQIIRDYFAEKNIQGEVIDYPFTDFADCRNVALRAIDGKTNFMVWIDADEILETGYGHNDKRFKDELADFDFCYIDCIKDGFKSRNIHFINLKNKWRWHGYVHEYLHVPFCDMGKLKATTMEGCTTVYGNDGASWKGDKWEKIEKYISLLERQHEKEPREGRWLYYIGNTYRALESESGIRSAIECFEKRVALYKGGNDSEAYASKLLALCLQQQIGYVITAEQFDNCRIFDSGNNRAEHIMYANDLYGKAKEYSKAYQLTLQAVKKFMRVPEGSNVNPSVYTFSVAHIHAINCFYTNRGKEGLEILDKLLNSIKVGTSVSLVPLSELERLKGALLAI